MAIYLKHPEEQLQKACIDWMRWQHKNVLCFHVPNGGQRNKVVAIKLKMTGVKSGIPDIFIEEAKGGYHGARIELKIKPNKPSDEQIKIMKQLELAGYYVNVCYSFDEFKAVVTDYLQDKLIKGL